jgi:tRNA (guanine37-N1)-methyltransferase
VSTPLRIDILTLFPDVFAPWLDHSILGIARDTGAIDIQVHDIRDWSHDPKHHKVDHRPYGGGPGMVLQPQPVVEAVEGVRALAEPAGTCILLSPQGEPFRHAVAKELSHEARLILICGHYEGFDERIRLILQPREVSIGDYVLTGGELPAMVMVDSIIRLVPGVLGDAASGVRDSFAGPALQYPHYTRPVEYRGFDVPEVLRSGDHAAIERWRLEQSRQRTQERRSDLLGNSDAGSN